MGNIYFEQHKYPSAIKMYRMALDQVPLTSRSVRSKILRNIGVAFMHVGQYQVLPFPMLLLVVSGKATSEEKCLVACLIQVSVLLQLSCNTGNLLNL